MLQLRQAHTSVHYSYEFWKEIEPISIVMLNLDCVIQLDFVSRLCN